MYLVSTFVLVLYLGQCGQARSINPVFSSVGSSPSLLEDWAQACLKEWSFESSPIINGPSHLPHALKDATSALGVPPHQCHMARGCATSPGHLGGQGRLEDFKVNACWIPHLFSPWSKPTTSLTSSPFPRKHGRQRKVSQVNGASLIQANHFLPSLPISSFSP